MSDSFDSTWESIHAAREWGTVPNEHMARFVGRNYPYPYGQYNVLDLGCGVGAQTRWLIEKGFTVCAVDGSKSAVHRLTEWLLKQPLWLDANIKVADVIDLPFNDSQFDFAIDVCCLQHLHFDLADAALAEIKRVLKLGGKLFSVTAKFDHSTEIADTPIRRTTRDQARKLYELEFGIEAFEESGFSDRGNWIAHWLVTCRKG